MASGSLPPGTLKGLGPELNFEEVRKFVEGASSSCLRLLVDDDDETVQTNGHPSASSKPARTRKGRYLVAKRAIKVGEVILRERPLYYGTPAGSYNSKVFNEEFLALMDDDSWEEELGDDELHPCSPLIDCVAGLLLSKRKALTHEDEELRALAAERVRQFWSLVRTSISESVPADAASEIFKVLKEEFQKIVSVEELHAALHTIACNRFGGGETDLDMMYAGSMFEHSCTPNIFLSTWQAGKSDGRHHYRALRDIPEGEALSIDYLLLPDGYLPTPDRAEILGRWGFVCSCARCTSLPDLSRTFVCPHCGKPELCPSSPSRRKYPGAIDPDGAAVTGDDTETMVCRSCGRRPTPEALAKADAHEVDLRRRRGEGSPWFGDGTLGDCHYAVFGYAWGCMRTGPQEIEDLQDYATAIEALLRCLSRFYDTDCHPQLLSLYHTMGALTANDIEVQKKWLGLERRCLERYYPEECEKQDDEIMRMCQGRGGPQGEEDKNAQNGTEVSPSEKERATLAPPTEPELPPAVADLRAGRWPQSIPKKQDVAAAAVHNFQPPPRGVITGPEDAIGMDSMD
eukprot:TRINITY_DN17270_c0_g2_i4.p1 TRINITY_DN17270_c0_g2~~TRINITY_DN17270_c0_g2_i4.p1  ORF type:complete len:572 (-),score=114.34 TRINITY_DN17270_c0_g2_i4:230-1945(-)